MQSDQLSIGSSFQRKRQKTFSASGGFFFAACLSLDRARFSTWNGLSIAQLLRLLSKRFSPRKQELHNRYQHFDLRIGNFPQEFAHLLSIIVCQPVWHWFLKFPKIMILWLIGHPITVSIVNLFFPIPNFSSPRGSFSVSTCVGVSDLPKLWRVYITHSFSIVVMRSSQWFSLY